MPKTLTITDAQLQKLIGSALRKKLGDAGLVRGTCSANSCTVCLPVNLDLAGEVDVSRDEVNGLWLFEQTLDTPTEQRVRSSEVILLETMHETRQRFT